MATYKITQDDGTEWGAIEATTPEDALLAAMTNADMTRSWSVQLGAGDAELGQASTSTISLNNDGPWHAWFFVRSESGVEMLQAYGR